MTSDQLAVERAAWAVTLKSDFAQSGYVFREHLNDYQTIFILTHPEMPGWRAKLTICSAHRQRNRVEINDQVMTQTCKTAARHQLMAALSSLRKRHQQDATSAKENEKRAALWQARQERELAGLPEINGVDVEIIRRGPHEGRYRVMALPGNPLETLTLEELKKFYEFLLCCRTNLKA